MAEYIVLDLLRVVGGEADEDRHADDEMAKTNALDGRKYRQAVAMITPIRPMIRDGAELGQVTLVGVAEADIAPKVATEMNTWVMLLTV